MWSSLSTSSREIRLSFGMITKKRTGQRSLSTLINLSWASSSGRTWWLLCSMRRLSFSISSLLNWLNRSILFQTRWGFALCRQLKSQFLKLFAFLGKREDHWRCSITVSFIWLFLTSFFLVVDKSIDLVIPAHDTEVGAMAVNPEGTLIASASARGHIIKLYSIYNVINVWKAFFFKKCHVCKVFWYCKFCEEFC